jgi:hypothetical protein
MRDSLLRNKIHTDFYSLLQQRVVWWKQVCVYSTLEQRRKVAESEKKRFLCKRQSNLWVCSGVASKYSTERASLTCFLRKFVDKRRAVFMTIAAI